MGCQILTAASRFPPILCQNGRGYVAVRNVLWWTKAAVRLFPPDRFFDRAEWSAITRASSWRGIWLVAHTWIVSFALIGVAAWSPNPALWLIAVIFVGGRQLRSEERRVGKACVRTRGSRWSPHHYKTQ